MRVLLLGALWALVSVPVAILAALAIRSAAGADIGEQVERYLRLLGTSPRRERAGRSVRTGTVLTVFAAALVGSAQLIGGLPARLVGAGPDQRNRFRPAPAADGDPGPTPDTVAPPSPRRSRSPSDHPDHPDHPGQGHGGERDEKPAH